MILEITVSVKEIMRKGRAYKWPRPKVCPGCKSHKLWGHGYVLAYFDGYNQGVWLRRYRCPACRRIFRLRPQGYWRRFQNSIATIHASLKQRLMYQRRRPDLPRGRQRHWLRALKRRVKAYLGQKWEARLLEGFDRLLLMHQIPVSRAI